MKTTGAVTTEVKMQTGPYVDTKHWSNDDVGLTFKCGAEHSELDIATKQGVDVPFGPKIYQADELVVKATIEDMALQDFAGTVEVKTFDGKQLAGTLALTAKRASGNTPITLTGTFQIACPPAFPKCAK